MVEKKGFTLWLTGLSGAGKTTLTERIIPELQVRGVRLEVLDGDEVRTNLSKGLGFSKEDRDTNIRRIGYVSRLLARNGVSVVTAAISPFSSVRDEVRNAIERDGAVFIEVFVKCPVEVLAGRDVMAVLPTGGASTSTFHPSTNRIPTVRVSPGTQRGVKAFDEK